MQTAIKTCNVYSSPPPSPASFPTLVILASVKITQRHTCTCTFLFNLMVAHGHKSNLQSCWRKGLTTHFCTTHKMQPQKIPSVSNQHLATQIRQYEPHWGQSYCRDVLLDCERKSRWCFVSDAVFIDLVVPLNIILNLSTREQYMENNNRVLITENTHLKQNYHYYCYLKSLKKIIVSLCI